MLDQDFCNFLEYHLSQSFKLSHDATIKNFWCDGITLPANDDLYALKSINDKREVPLKGFLGNEGQEEFSVLMKFGPRSLSKYARGLDIKDCLPAIETGDWYFIDTTSKSMIIQLD
jgi:hypothetical protein